MAPEISRRDFLKLAAVVSGGITLSACRPNPMELPTLTAIVPTTATPSQTATHTATPRPTGTSTPTDTPFPTDTPPFKSWVSPTKLQYDRWFSWENPLWSDFTILWGDYKTPGVEMKAVDDPLLGPSILFVITEVRPGNRPFRVYPGKVTPHQKGEFDWAMEVPIIGRKGYFSSGGASLISNFSKVAELDMGVWQVIAGIDTYQGRPEITVKDPVAADQSEWAKYKSRRKFLEDKKYVIRVFTHGDMIYLKVNEEIWASGKLHPDFVGVAPVATHAGAYGFRIPIGAELLNGPLTLELRKL